jgi:hypothetical protein
MTRLNIPHALSSKPTTVAISELAVTAGAIGRGMTLCFEGFPASTLCQLWKYCIRCVGLEVVQGCSNGLW